MTQTQAPNPVAFTDPSGVMKQLQTQFIAGKYAAVTLNTAASTNPQTLVTAPAGQYYFVPVIQITIDPTATIAAAGMVSITLQDATDGVIAMLRAYIPASAGAPTVPTVIRQTNSPGAFYASSTKGSTLTAWVSTALSAASIRVSVTYGYSSVAIGNT